MGQVLELIPLHGLLEKSRKNKKVVFTNGCFDLLHVGHIRYLQEAKTLGDILVVGINSDKSVRGLKKGPDRPIQNQDDRAIILAALAAVDYVCVFDEPTPLGLIEKIKPDVLVKGGDWKPDQIVGADVVLKGGGMVRSLQFVEGRSTSEIVEKIKRL